MKRYKRKILVALVLLGALGVFGFLTRNFWNGQFRAFYLGQLEFTAEHYQDLPKDIDTVEVFTLESNGNGNTNGFVGDLKLGTVEHKTLTGADAKEIVELWGHFKLAGNFKRCVLIPLTGYNLSEMEKFIFRHRFVGNVPDTRFQFHFLGPFNLVLMPTIKVQ